MPGVEEDGDGGDEFGGAAQGPQVLPGTYRARLTVTGQFFQQRYTQPFKVTLDPRSTATALELQKQLDLCLAISRAMSAAAREGRTLKGPPNAAAQAEIAAVARLLGAALNAAESADRTPPASAYEIFQQASRRLTALLARP